MTVRQQVIEMRDYCDEILNAGGPGKVGIYSKYLWKIKTIAADLEMELESGDLTEEDL